MTKKQPKIQRNPEFKSEALQLAATIGIPAAAKELGLHTSPLYSWNSAAHEKATQSERESQLATEVTKLKRLLANQAEELLILKKAATYFAINQK